MVSTATSSLPARQRLLDAALARFSDDGALAATLDGVRQDAGVSVGTLYHHFADKRALATALVAPEEERPLRTLVQNAFGMRRKQMRRVVRSLYALDAPAADELLAAAGVDPEVRPETLSPEQFVALLRSMTSTPSL